MKWGLGSLLEERIHPVVWVTNAAGFLGSFLCERLLKQGTHVIAIDTWESGVIDNLSHLKKDKDFELVNHDITKPIPQIIPNPHYIFHLESSLPFYSDLLLPFLREQARGTEELLEVAQKFGAKFLLACAANPSTASYHLAGTYFSQALVGGFIKEKHIDGRIVRLGNVYGPRMPLSSEDQIAHVFKTTIYNQPITVAQTFITPLFVEDAVQGILAAMFSSGTHGKTFSFDAPKMLVSEFAAQAKRVFDNKQWQIAYNRQEDKTSRVLEDTLIVAPTPLSRGIALTFAFLKEKLLRATPSRREEKKLFRKPILQTKLVALTWTIILALGLAGLPLFLFGIADLSLQFAKGSLASFSFVPATRFLVISQKGFALSHSSLAWFEDVPLISKFVSPMRHQAQAQKLVTQTLLRVVQVGTLGTAALSDIVDPTLIPSTEKELVALGNAVEALGYNLGFLKTANITLEAVEPLGLDATQLNYLSRLLHQAPDLLGYKEKKTYLVLLQNTLKLRPTGGVIEAFALIGFEGGKLKDIKVYDSDFADGKLGGRVEPPDPIRRYSKQENWLLQDSNWDPHFPESAAWAEWFLDKELNVQVDGVIAVDLELVRSLLTLTGPLSLPEFSIQLSEYGFYEKVRLFTKEGFLASVARALASRLPDLGEQPLGLVNVLGAAVRDRHVLIMFHNQTAQSAVRALSWDGGIKSAKCKVPASRLGGQNAKCKDDYLFIVEANMDTNIADYALSRSYLLEISFEEQYLIHDLRLSYINNKNKRTNALSQRSYIRLYTSPGASLVLALLTNPGNGEKHPLVVDKTTEYGKTVFGALIEVPPGETRQVLLTWQLELLKDTSSLALLWQKQAGTSEDPVTLRFYKPEDRQLQLIPPASLTDKKGFVYNTLFKADLQTIALWPELHSTLRSEH